jgi:RNase H-fold protein (predicted Holliday junction resolvase)
MLHYAPPTNEQLLQLRQRLLMPYVLPPNYAAAASAATTGAARLPRPSTECSVLSLDVGDRFVGVAVSEARMSVPAVAATAVGGGWKGDALLLPRRAEPLQSLQRLELVARGGPLPTSPHSHHQRSHHSSNNKKTDLRGPSSSARRVLKPRSPAVLAAELCALLVRHRSVAVVVGMPLTLAHELDEQCDKTIEFVQQMQMELAKFDAPIAAGAATSRPSGSRSSITATAAAKTASGAGAAAFEQPWWCYWDERLSSVDARQQLSAAGVRAHSRSMAQQTDSMAAAIVLQEFLERIHLVFSAQAQVQQRQEGSTSLPRQPPHR